MTIMSSRRFIVGILIFCALIWALVYLQRFAFTGLDRAAYDRGEETYILGLAYFGKVTHGGGVSPFPEGLGFKTEDGRTLSQEEMIKVINPELNPFVRDGKIYTRTREWSEWGERVYWTPTNPITTGIAKAVRFIHREG